MGRLVLLILPLLIVGCATTPIDTSTPRAQALMQEVRAERLVAEVQNKKDECMVSFASDDEARIDCIGKADSYLDEYFKNRVYDAQMARNARDARIARDQLTKNQAESQPESKGYSFLQELLGAVVEGVVEASVNEVLDLNCDEVVEVSSKTKQVIPGSPQYGSKTKTTVKTKRCP